jgi:dipeptidase E
MKRRDFIHSTAAISAGLPLINLHGSKIYSHELKRKLFIFGGTRDAAFMKYIIQVTGKENPKICFVPTATGDSLNSITSWYSSCEDLPLRPYVLRTFISSYNTKKSFEETIMSMDAIVVGGGNTLNMIAIWRSQGIDLALKKAYDAGVVMSGGSAGSLCWFQNGTTDSRPIKVTKIEGLGWIKGSHCPHYDSEESRRPLYHELVKSGELYPGYACDDKAGIYFENEKMVSAVSVNDKSKSYYVELVDGKIVEKELESKIIN